MPHVSVAIPAYKPRHLAQAIASVLAQTFEDYELLISDDQPDGSVRAIVERFRDPRIRLIEGPRQGLIPNSVHLWEAASADLLKYVYDDDFLLPFALAELVQLIKRRADLTFAFCSRHIVDEGGGILHSVPALTSEDPKVLAGEVLADAIIGGVFNHVGEPTNVLIRRSAFDGPDCLRRYCGVAVRHHIDLAFYLNAAQRGPCIGTPRFGAAFRRHPAQVTSNHLAPDFSYGVVEWELFIRGAVQMGAVPPRTALRSFERLQAHYDRHRQAFPELAAMAAGLSQLRTDLENGAQAVLNGEFLQRLNAVESAIQARTSG